MNKIIILNNQQIEYIIKKYAKQKKENKNPYIILTFNIEQSVISLFTTGKLLIQGKNTDFAYNLLCHELGISLNDSIKKISQMNIIGADEVGTGDYFGSIVVCATIIPEEKEKYIRKLHLRDSKEINDEKIVKLATILKEQIPYSLVFLDNEKYNEIIKDKKMNLNKIKAILHNQNILKLLQQGPKVDDIIIDGFTSTSKYYEYLKDQETIVEDVKLIEKAENIYLSIAAASIIARAAFLENLTYLSQKYQICLPKGAGYPVDEAIKNIILSGKKEILSKIGKINFNNTKKVENSLKNKSL